MSLTLEIAAEEDAAQVAGLHFDASGGKYETVLNEVVRRMRKGRVLVARRRNKVIATLCLTTKKPWAIDASYFTPVSAPLYLVAMAVAVPLQRSGIGRRCLLEAEKIACLWPADAIRLDAHDNAAGAGGFYERCGYREMGRVAYRRTPLIYYERLIAAETARNEANRSNGA